jgi:hypothetical protein
MVQNPRRQLSLRLHCSKHIAQLREINEQSGARGSDGFFVGHCEKYVTSSCPTLYIEFGNGNLVEGRDLEVVD